VRSLTRAADADREAAARLAAAVLGRRPQLWPAALAAAWTQGGPFTGPLETLASAADTPLPLTELARDIPIGHGALRGLALTAAQRSRPSGRGTERTQQELSHDADLLNTLAIRQADTGDRGGALTSITEAAHMGVGIVDLAVSRTRRQARQPARARALVGPQPGSP
jgi:hypothetical protein